MNNWFKKNGIHFAVAAIFIVLAFAYFLPALQGKVIGQNDVTRAQSTQKEIMDYREKGTTILWTNQILGGMPAYQIWAPYSNNVTGYVINAINRALPNPVGLVLVMMLGAYFLFSVLRMSPWVAAAGALAFTFTSYNFIYLVAGHANQVLAILFFAPILASVLLILRGRHLLGGSLLALFLALEIKANHLQMTYYLMIALLILMIFELVNAVKTKQVPAFVKSLGFMAAALALALAVNASVLWSTADYAADSIRGKSNLTKGTTEPKNGVSRDYAYEYSEGVGEALSFLIPNIYGGSSSSPANPDSHVVQVLTGKGVNADQAQNFAQGLPMYWGEKTFTEGPWYFGAVICLLFVFGLMIVKNRLKWFLLATVLITMFLSFGKNLPFLSDLFFNYFPLYNKFRAVESILVVASLCFPIMAFLAIDEVIKATDKQALVKKLLIALYITGGLCLVVIAIPDTFFNFASSTHQTLIDQLTQVTGGDRATAGAIAGGLVQDRISLARTDAIRSLVFVALGFGLVWLFLKQKLNLQLFTGLVLLVVLVDMWTVDKRYLKDDSFVDKADVQKPHPRDIDQFILRDPDPDYRVFDTTVPLMQDAFNPYFHKSIGGYSAARMKRYDELMEAQMTKSINHDVLDMLNAKYIISADPKTQAAGMHVNETACGNAWFIKNVRFAENADQEMQAISSFSPKDEAIVDKQYRSAIDDKATGYDPNAKITLTSYNPDHMTYESTSATQQVAVFSEIYYNKGWKMLIDGKESPYFRADYVLRAAQLPVGNHKIEFVFHPASYYTGETISLIGSIILVLALGGAIYLGVKKQPELAVK